MENAMIAGWLGGLLIGWFVVLHFLVLGRSAGCSSGYACVVNKLQKNLNWLTKLDSLKLCFIIGLPIGGLIHALIFQDQWQISFDMGMYESILPESDLLKVAVLFLGGTLLGLGARMAGGCTTGHALVGGALLNWVSILAAILFFAFAMATTWLMFVWL